MNDLAIETSSISALEPDTTIRPESPGSRLRKARESKRLTVEEMAKRLRYTNSRIQQLENDDYHLMGAATFARGYLRSYAGQLNFSKDEILDILRAFDQLELGGSISSHKPTLIREEIRQVNPQLARRIGYGIIALLVVLVLAWWYSNRPAVNANSTTTADAATSEATGKVQLEVVPLQGNTTDPNNSNANMVELPLPTLQPNRISPTSRTPLQQTASQSVPQNTVVATTPANNPAAPANPPKTPARSGG